MEYTRERDVLICDNFYIANKKSIISEQVKDGFPFFSGSLRLRKNIKLDNGKSLIERKEYAITRQRFFRNSYKEWYHIKKIAYLTKKIFN